MKTAQMAIFARKLHALAWACGATFEFGCTVYGELEKDPKGAPLVWTATAKIAQRTLFVKTTHPDNERRLPDEAAVLIAARDALLELSAQSIDEWHRRSGAAGLAAEALRAAGEP